MPFFFIPYASSQEAAEAIWQGFAEKYGGDPNQPRIFRIQTVIEGKPLTLEVGKPSPSEYGGGLVLAILFLSSVNRYAAFLLEYREREPASAGEVPALIGGRITTVEEFDRPQ